MSEVFNLVVGSDNGNSEHDLVINGTVVKQPNVYAMATILANLDEVNPDYVAKNIHSNLLVSIESPSVNSNMPATYYIGNMAIESGNYIHNIEIGVDNNKLTSNIPVINTLAHTAGFAAAQAYEKDNTVRQIDVNIDMTTALPVNQYNKETAKTMAEKFIGEHIVTVYFGTTKVRCMLHFTYVKVLPEGVPTVFYLKSPEGKKLIPEIKSLDNKKILHVAIGEGTTEYPVTTDITFNPFFMAGTNNGIGHAIDKIIEQFKKEKKLADFSRQNFSNVLKNDTHKYHKSAMEIIQMPLMEQADQILRAIKAEVVKAKNDIDFILVYGGGSILLRKYLENQLKEFANNAEIQVIYIPSTHAVEVEALGLYKFAKSDIFAQLKEKYTTVSQK
ncbi:MAG: ParM/StbA family protein [Clostridia bacterium]|nr:ParM/StbA family protein [Clostridia bacterium]